MFQPLHHGFSLVLLLTVCLITGCDPAPQESGSVTEPMAGQSLPAMIIAQADSEETAASGHQSEESNSVTDKTDVTVVPVAHTTIAEKTFKKEGITLKIADWKAIEALIAAQKGKVVVVDLWSSWCLPCVREYPHLVELQQKYPDQVVCISVNLNYDGSEDSPPESHAEEVLAFLVKQKSKLINVLASTPDETIYETIDLASIPVAYVYQSDGKLNKRFDNETQAYGEEGFNYKQHIFPLVEKLLQK